MKETDITRAIRRLLKQHNIWHFKHAASPYGRNGIADILGIIDGRFLAIEVKQPGHKPTLAQMDFLKEVNSAGGLGFVATNTQEVISRLGLPDLFSA